MNSIALFQIDLGLSTRYSWAEYWSFRRSLLLAPSLAILVVVCYMLDLFFQNSIPQLEGLAGCSLGYAIEILRSLRGLSSAPLQLLLYAPLTRSNIAGQTLTNSSKVIPLHR